MATRCAIALADGDRLLGIYSHWDGYLEGVGKTLLEHYNDRAKVEELIKLGNVSSLRREIGPSRPFENSGDWGTEEYQLFEAQYGHITTFYGRDRGEPDQEYVEFKFAREFVEYFSESWCEYFYIYANDDTWWVLSKEQTLWEPLGDALRVLKESE